MHSCTREKFFGWPFMRMLLVSLRYTITRVAIQHPSMEDRAITDQLVAAGRIIGIPVFDHLVVGAGRYVSFSESKLL